MESTICSLPAGMWLSLLGWELGEAGERVLCEIICNGLGSWEARFGSLEEQMKAVLLLNHLWLLTKRNKFSFYKVSNPSTVYPVCYYVWCGALSPCGPRKGSCKLFWKEPPASHTSVVLILSGSFIPMQYMLMWEKGKNYSLVFSDFLRLWNCIVIPESGKKVILCGFSEWIVLVFFLKHAHGHNVFSVCFKQKMSQVRDICRLWFLLIIILAPTTDLPLVAHVLQWGVYAGVFCNAFAQVSRA